MRILHAVCDSNIVDGLPVLQHLRLDVDAVRAEDEGALLGWLEARNSLSDLYLNLSRLLGRSTEVTAAYSAVTASNQLTRLSLRVYRGLAGLCQQLFPEGRLLP